MLKIINDKAVSALRKRDIVFATIVDNYGIPVSWSREPGFPTMCKIILEQQVSLESAEAAYHKLIQAAGECSPSKILRLSLDEMRSATISRQKAGYLHGLSQLILNGSIDLENLSELSEELAYNELIKIKGVGPWTARIYLMFALQSPDIYPPGDVALINTIKELWSDVTKENLIQKTEEWSPYRSTACYLLWHHYLVSRGRVHPGG